MKANELRIGNWVEDHITNKPFQISAWNFNTLSKGIPMPIPLTEEWLVKFGLTRHHSDYYNGILLLKDVVNIDTGVQYDFFRVKIFPHELGSAQSVAGGLHIKHVHQLQNLYFALTGEELELKTND